MSATIAGFLENVQRRVREAAAEGLQP